MNEKCRSVATRNKQNMSDIYLQHIYSLIRLSIFFTVKYEVSIEVPTFKMVVGRGIVIN